MNYYIQDFCCICLSISNEKWSNRSSKYSEFLTPIDKIKTIFLQLSAVMDNDNRICMKCSGIVDLIYDFNKTCLKNINILNSYRKVLKENQSKNQCDLFVNLNESKQFKENTVTSNKVKIEPPESPLNNNVLLSDDYYVSENYSSRSAEVKEEIEVKNETCDGESERSWSDSEMKIDIEETDLKKEWMDEISTTTEIESLNANIQDSVNISVQSTEELGNEEEKDNRESIEDHLLEIAEEISNEKQGRRESIEENQSKTSKEELNREDEKNLDCLKCGKTLGCKLDLDRHMLSHSRRKTNTGSKGHKCDICGKVFTTKGAIRIHMLIHTDEKPYKCNICGKVFRQSGNLQVHKLIHTGSKPDLTKCDICGILIATKRYVKKHMLLHTGEKPHKCDLCGKLFYNPSNLKRHKVIHTSEKPHICDTCGTSFNTKTNLYRHMFIHTNEKSFNCDICGKLFSQKSDIKRHKLIHTGEKPFKCDFCGKYFKQLSHMKNHKLSHSEEKRYKCDICGKLFARKGSITIHMQQHTGQKRYKCDICGKLFTTKAYIKIHMLKHTGDKRLKCDICGKLFTSKQCIKDHIVNTHW